MARQGSEEQKALVRKAPAYQYIRAWGSMMGSFPYYVDDEQQRAAADNAPVDAIYHTWEYADGRSAPAGYSDEQMRQYGIRRVWKTVRDIASPETRWSFSNHCTRLRIDPPMWPE